MNPHADTVHATTTHDSSGYRIFHDGELGAAHAMAHRMLDTGRLAEGYQRLGDWLRGRSGSGGRWTHVQWHQLVFELAVGAHHAAFTRLVTSIVPAGDAALTDAPAAMWRVALASPERVDLPWGDVAAVARRWLYRSDDPYVVLHHLLALAGAGDLDALDAWLAGHGTRGREDRTLHAMGLALRCLASGDDHTSVSLFELALPRLSELGGSRAQNELFESLRQLALSRAAGLTCPTESMAWA